MDNKTDHIKWLRYLLATRYVTTTELRTQIWLHGYSVLLMLSETYIVIRIRRLLKIDNKV